MLSLKLVEKDGKLVPKPVTGFVDFLLDSLTVWFADGMTTTGKLIAAAEAYFGVRSVFMLIDFFKYGKLDFRKLLS